MALLRGTGQIVGKTLVRDPTEALWLMLSWALEETELSPKAIYELCEAAYTKVEAANLLGRESL